MFHQGQRSWAIRSPRLGRGAVGAPPFNKGDAAVIYHLLC